MRAVTDGRFKLIKYDVDGNATQETQLFDLETNPFELLPEHGVTNLAEHKAMAGVRQRLETALMSERLANNDPDAFLGDRTLLRFEDGGIDEPAATLEDSLPFGNHATALSGTGGSLPHFSADVPSPTDFVLGLPNERSLAFEQNLQHHLRLDDDQTLDFGNNPFTIEAWVKLASLPTGPDGPGTMPIVMKKPTGAGDESLDYLFLATAGRYGDATTFGNLALHLGGAVIVSSLAIPDTGWHHISVALDPGANRVRFTLDDQVDTRATGATGTSNNGPVLVGVHIDRNGLIDASFDGLLDELSITDGCLPERDLQPLGGIAPPAPFQILGITRTTEGSFDLTFESRDDLLYDLEQSASLQSASWTKMRTFIPGALGADETTIRNVASSPADPDFFYRLVAYGPTGR